MISAEHIEFAIPLDWSEYDRLLGEFLRTYIDGEHLGVEQKLKALKGGTTYLLRRHKRHKNVRHRISHWTHFHLRSGGKGPWRPCMITTSMVAQVFLGINPLELSIKGGRDFGGKVTTEDHLKKAIGEMRLAAFVAEGAGTVGRMKGGAIMDGRKVKRLPFTLQPNKELNIAHIKRVPDEKRNSEVWIDQYDENAKGVEQWGELDQSVGSFFRSWSEVLVALRQLEIMQRNPSGPRDGMDLSGKGTDMKRAEFVLGRNHWMVGWMRNMSKEKGSLLLRGRRMLSEQQAVIVDPNKPRGNGGRWAVYAHSVAEVIEDGIVPAVKAMGAIVKERKLEWYQVGSTG